MTGVQASLVVRHIRGLAGARETDLVTDGQLLESFAAGRDEAAFAELIRRHGPLVLGVCRRILHNAQDAEDAFQATFLQLARKAGSIGRSGSVGSWLYRVAYHAAVKARARTALRRSHERRAVPPRSADPLAEITGRELLAVVDEEMAQLPLRQRAALVACCLQGKTGDEAARALGWSVRTLKRRLHEGREQLRARLGRRGLSLPATFLVAGILSVPVSEATASTTARAALAALSAPLAVASVRPAWAAILLAGLTVAGVGWAASQGPVDPKSAAEPAERPAAGQPEKRNVAEAAPKMEGAVTGRVLGADGKPVVGGQLAAIIRLEERHTADEIADLRRLTPVVEADRDGRFRLPLTHAASGAPNSVQVVATAPGYGIAWQSYNPNDRKEDLVFRLSPEQVVRGRVVDLQGAPAAGVRLRVREVRQRGRREPRNWPLWAIPKEFPLVPAPLTTDAQGRFELHGIGPDRTVAMEVRSDRFAPQQLEWDTVPGARQAEETRSLAPPRTLYGRVTCEDTGKPLAGARLSAHAGPSGGVHTGAYGRTDSEGKYQIDLFPGEEVSLAVFAPDGTPYLSLSQGVDYPKGVVRHERNVALPRGVLVRGKVTEAPSGKPVAGASVDFLPREVNNPHFRGDVPNAWTGEPNAKLTGPDGTFALAVLPGPGHLLVRAPTPDYVLVETSGRRLTHDKPGGQSWYFDGLESYDLSPQARPVERNVVLRRGVTVRGRLVGPEGQPVGAAQMLFRPHFDLSGAMPSHLPVPLRDGRFELRGCDPEKTYTVYFLDVKNQWGAKVEVAGKQADGEPLTVRLAPCGSARVRFLNGTGRPVPDRGGTAQLILRSGCGPYDYASFEKGQLAEQSVYLGFLDPKNYVGGPRSDAEGRLVYPSLIPGATYRLDGAPKDVEAKAGKTLDLGDVVIDAAK
jgi:RNA polymerase sigma factor (sigma-70 family)